MSPYARYQQNQKLLFGLMWRCAAVATLLGIILMIFQPSPVSDCSAIPTCATAFAVRAFGTDVVLALVALVALLVLFSEAYYWLYRYCARHRCR
jgi:ABC-type sulfate transport system permease component